MSDPPVLKYGSLLRRTNRQAFPLVRFPKAFTPSNRPDIFESRQMSGPTQIPPPENRLIRREFTFECSQKRLTSDTCAEFTEEIAISQLSQFHPLSWILIVESRSSVLEIPLAQNALSDVFSLLRSETSFFVPFLFTPSRSLFDLRRKLWAFLSTYQHFVYPLDLIALINCS